MLLPEPRRRGEIHFWVGKSLPYRARLALSGALLVAGFGVQAGIDLGLGAALLLAASSLGLVKGYTNVPDLGRGRAEWRGAEVEQLQKVVKMSRRARGWDQSLLDVTCATGVMALVVAGLAVVVAVHLLSLSGHSWLARAAALDSAVLLLPHWITGVRRILTNDPLVVKIEMLLSAVEAWEAGRQDGEVMQPHMEVIATERGELPVDAKLVLRSESLGDAFLGLQVQVTLNNVQGKDYPYLYCVLVARRPLAMPKQLAALSEPKGMVVSWEDDPAEGLDILVIRQSTYGKTGYHTDEGAARRIFAFALEQARQLVVETPG